MVGRQTVLVLKSDTWQTVAELRIPPGGVECFIIDCYTLAIARGVQPENDMNGAAP